jgi:hypothetical protein
MNIFEEYTKLVEQRKKIMYDIDYEHDPIILKSIELFSKDMKETVKFLKNDITGEQFVWLSEIVDDVAEKTQSREFVDMLYKVAEKYPEETKKYHILKCIAYAEGALEE